MQQRPVELDMLGYGGEVNRFYAENEQELLPLVRLMIDHWQPEMISINYDEEICPYFTEERLAMAIRNGMKSRRDKRAGIIPPVWPPVRMVKDGEPSRGTLIDTKASWGRYVDKRTGKFFTWFTGGTMLLEQAERQVKAAKYHRADITWYFDDLSAVCIVRKMLFDARLPITVHYSP